MNHQWTDEASDMGIHFLTLGLEQHGDWISYDRCKHPCGPKESPVASSNHEATSTKRGGPAARASSWGKRRCPKMGVSKNGGFTRENLIKMMMTGDAAISGNHHLDGWNYEGDSWRWVVSNGANPNIQWFAAATSTNFLDYAATRTSAKEVQGGVNCVHIYRRKMVAIMGWSNPDKESIAKLMPPYTPP